MDNWKFSTGMDCPAEGGGEGPTCRGSWLAQDTFTPVKDGDALGDPTTGLGVGSGWPSAVRSPPRTTCRATSGPPARGGAARGCHSAGQQRCPHLRSKPIAMAGLQVTVAGLLSAQ